MMPSIFKERIMKRLYLRLPDELVIKLKELAIKSDRTINNLITILLKKIIKENIKEKE